MFHFLRRRRLGPFLFIAAMPRSGSTLLAGMLTRKPHAVILSEPGFQRGIHHNLEQFKDIPGVEIGRLARHRGRPRKMLAAFRRQVVPQILKTYRRLGVKECFLDNWRLYEEFFDDVRYIILARDPRDVMLSVLDYGEHADWHKKMWADRSDEHIAAQFSRTWSHQLDMLNSSNCLRVRYEDLCRGKVGFSAIAKFCGLDFDEPGSVSQSLEAFPWRAWEIERHSGRLTESAVHRWKEETDETRLQRVHSLAKLMSDYCGFWGY